MTYATAQALRMALEQRLLARSHETGISLDRLRRRVLFERVVARLESAEPSRWVVKGGMALEVRLGDRARLTKDIDLGLRDEVADAAGLHERLVEALRMDPDNDRFVLTPRVPALLGADSAGHPTWRTSVVAQLGGKPFGGVQVDVSPRAHELGRSDRITLPNSLDFAGVAAREADVVDIHRHAAEKFHGMLRDHGQRENTRVRDLVDLVMLSEHGLVEPQPLAIAAREVWAERNGSLPPAVLPDLPGSWPARYERLADDYDLAARTFALAVAAIRRLWADMAATEEA